MPFLDYVAIGIFVVAFLIYLLKSKRKKDRYGEFMNYDTDDVNDPKNPTRDRDKWLFP